VLGSSDRELYGDICIVHVQKKDKTYNYQIHSDFVILVMMY
jgi:hypothetical protein